MSDDDPQQTLPADPSPEAAADTPGFAESLEELEEILRRIEEEETDVDRLATELRRAAQLLEICRGKLKKAEVEVTQIVQSLDEEDEPSDPDDS